MIEKITGIQDIFDVTPTTLASIMSSEYIHEIPTSCETIEDLKNVEQLLPKIVNQYAFLVSMASFVKVRTRQEKRAGHKEMYEDLIDKGVVLNNTIDVLKMQQKTLSRLVTIKNTINEEIHMSEGY